MYEKSLVVLHDLFAKDCTFALATSKNNIPSQRVVDTYYKDGVFWIVTYAKSQKLAEILSNPNVSLCSDFQKFQGKAYFMGHPLAQENKEIRDILIKVFEPWYFAHNNENDENMCYVKVVPEFGSFHKDGTGYAVDFLQKSVKSFPFAPTL